MHLIKKNIIWSLVGNVLPLLAGVLLIPDIIQSYGLERFGLLAIAWSLVGYFGLFDVGMSRALTYFISKCLSQPNQQNNINEVAYTTLRAMWLLGAVGTAMLFISAPALVKYVLNVSSSIRAETTQAFFILSACIPFVLHAAALKGVMDAFNLFKQSSFIRMVFGAGMFIAPFIASYFGANLVNAMISLVILRVIVWYMHYYFINQLDILKSKKLFNFKWLKILFKFGGWITVSNIIGPLMVYMDRFLIASLLGASLVAFYVAPYEVVIKLLVIPAGFTTVLFPLFAKVWLNNPQQAADMLHKGLAYILIALVPIVILLSYFSNEWLRLWLGDSFASKSASIAVWLVAGVLMNSLAQILYAYVQGTGKSDWTAKLHMLEAIPYWLALWYFLKNHGLQGAAITWFLRCFIDCFSLAYLAVKINAINKSAIFKPIMLSIALAVVLIASLLINTFSTRVLALLFLIVLYGISVVRIIKKDKVLAFINQRLSI